VVLLGTHWELDVNTLGASNSKKSKLGGILLERGKDWTSWLLGVYVHNCVNGLRELAAMSILIPCWDWCCACKWFRIPCKCKLHNEIYLHSL
jgi:hypothetical protein